MLAPTSQIPMLKLKRPEIPANMDLAKLGRRITPFRPILGIQRAAIGNQKLLAKHFNPIAVQRMFLAKYNCLELRSIILYYIRL